MPKPAVTEIWNRDEVLAVLRYWLAAIQAEASISARPRAQRGGGKKGAQAYVRVDGPQTEQIVGGSGVAELPVGDAEARFLEHWTRTERRREQLSGDGTGPAWSLGWPTFYFRGREELATLIRTPVDLEWRRSGARWTQKGRGPPPNTLVIQSRGRQDDDDELAIDRELLSSLLGMLDEEIAALEKRTSADAAKTAEKLIAALDGATGDDGLLEGLVRAIEPKLPPGVSVWPKAIVQDPGLFHATYHLQKDLAGLIGDGDRPTRLSTSTVLWAYLTGRSKKRGRAPMLGRFRERGLTASQRAAGERFLGSQLTAVQGPPGTGKTELILSLAAHTVVERIDALVDGLQMPSEQLVVASTNNRAVDNVLDPLSTHLPPDRLPIALRAGNQEVTASATVDALRRATDWLKNQSDADASAKLDDALVAFKTTADALRALIEPQEERLRQRARIEDLEALIARAEREEAEAPQQAQLVAAIDTIGQEVERMTKIIEAKRGDGKLARVKKRWAALVAEIPVLADADSPIARALGLPPEVPEETDDDDALDLWEDALLDAASAVDATRDRAPAHARPERRKAWAEELSELREAVAREGDVEPDPTEVETLAHQLYLCALTARERWAIVHRADLLEGLEDLRERIVDTRSLRRAAAKRSRASGTVRRLFPVLGSTLLSMGNVFEDSTDVIDRLVIDEAGQCHPAYAISGLMRSRSALIIGDVHQLPPVIRLSESDDDRLQRASHVDFADERFHPFRVHERSGTSAQQLADRAVETRPTLTDHFRCHPDIIAVSDALAGYGLTVHRSSTATTNAPLDGAVLFSSTTGRQVRARGSWTNTSEADALLSLLEVLVSAGVPHGEIGIITPFVGQEQMLRTELSRRRLLAAGLGLGTVHRFQGGERAIVLFSAVVTEARSLPFVDDRPNLLNVAVSRARDHLVIFGHADTLRAGKNTRLLVDLAKPFAAR